MSTGYPPPGPPGPQFAGPPVPGWPSFTAPTYAPPPLSDLQLRQLPPPPVQQQLPPGTPGAPGADQQRPAVIAIAATLAITAGLLWMAGLGLLWVTATVGAADLGQQGAEGGLFHILNRFNYRLVDGLAWPLFGFPLLAVVTGFLLLSGRAWTRIAHTALGVLALGWAAWWLREDLTWWISPACYVAFACLVLWTPAVTRWYTRPGVS